MTTADSRTDQSTDLADHVGGISHGVGPIDRVRAYPLQSLTLLPQRSGLS
jgi:hypothetical protein